MIKLNLKRHLLYLLAYYISWIIRCVINIVLQVHFEIDPLYIFLYLMILGEIIGGISIFLYQFKSIRKKEETKYFGLYLIYNEEEIKIKDNMYIITLLIFFAAFFDFYSYYMRNIYIGHEYNVTELNFKLSGVQGISSALICTYGLRFKIKNHHKISLITLSLFLILAVLIEVLILPSYIELVDYLVIIGIILYSYIIYTFNGCLEKYLVDTDYMNPFKLLMFEGACEIVMAILCSINQDPFGEIKDLCNNISTGNLILLIFLFFLYFILSIIVNVYKVYCNVIYSPMARSLINYIMNPIFNIYFFCSGYEFSKDYLYFIFCELVHLVISFFGCIYNEYIIISCCNLEHETKYAITERASDSRNIPIQNDNEIDENYSEHDNEGDEINQHNISKNSSNGLAINNADNENDNDNDIINNDENESDINSSASNKSF